MTVIIGALLITVLASLFSKAGKAQTAIGNLGRHASSYTDLTYTSDPNERERIYQALLEEEAYVKSMAKKYRDKAKDVEKIREEVAEAHQQHEHYLNS